MYDVFLVLSNVRLYLVWFVGGFIDQCTFLHKYSRFSGKFVSFSISLIKPLEGILENEIFFCHLKIYFGIWRSSYLLTK